MNFGRGENEYHLVGSSYLKYEMLEPIIMNISSNSMEIMKYMINAGITHYE